MADDEETSGTPWGLIFLGIFFLFAATFFFMGVSAPPALPSTRATFWGRVFVERF